MLEVRQIPNDMKVSHEQVRRMENLLCDLIKLTARCHEKIDYNESKIQQLNHQIVILEAYISTLSDEKNDSNPCFERYKHANLL